MYYVRMLTKQGHYKTVVIKDSIEDCESLIINYGLHDTNYVITDDNFNIIKKLKGGNDYDI